MNRVLQALKTVASLCNVHPTLGNATQGLLWAAMCSAQGLHSQPPLQPRGAIWLSPSQLHTSWRTWCFSEGRLQGRDCTLSLHLFLGCGRTGAPVAITESVGKALLEIWEQWDKRSPARRPRRAVPAPRHVPDWCERKQRSSHVTVTLGLSSTERQTSKSSRGCTPGTGRGQSWASLFPGSLRCLPSTCPLQQGVTWLLAWAPRCAKVKFQAFLRLRPQANTVSFLLHSTGESESQRYMGRWLHNGIKPVGTIRWESPKPPPLCTCEHTNV